MKVALFGATGRTGKHFIPLALNSGHTIKALARDPSRLQGHEHRLSHLRVARGDITDYQAVSKIVAGSDVVVNLLGHARDSPKDIMVLSTKHIIQAANEHPVRLVITLTTAGVKNPADTGSISQFLMNFYLKHFETAQIEDHQAMCDMIRDTKDVGFEWIVVRAARLTDGALTKRYHLRTDRGHGLNLHVSRADVAHCIVTLLTNGEHRGQMPFVFM